MFKIIEDIVKGRKNLDWEKIKSEYNNSRIARKLRGCQIPTDLGRFILFTIILSLLVSLVASVFMGFISFFATPVGGCVVMAIIVFLLMRKKMF